MTMREPNTVNITRRFDVHDVCNVQGMEAAKSLTSKGIAYVGKQEPGDTEGVIGNGLRNIEHGHNKEIKEGMLRNTPVWASPS
jgi:hypothetical protein